MESYYRPQRKMFIQNSSFNNKMKFDLNESARGNTSPMKFPYMCSDYVLNFGQNNIKELNPETQKILAKDNVGKSQPKLSKIRRVKKPPLHPLQNSDCFKRELPMDPITGQVDIWKALNVHQTEAAIAQQNQEKYNKILLSKSYSNDLDQLRKAKESWKQNEQSFQSPQTKLILDQVNLMNSFDNTKHFKQQLQRSYLDQQVASRNTNLNLSKSLQLQQLNSFLPDIPPPIKLTEQKYQKKRLAGELIKQMIFKQSLQKQKQFEKDQISIDNQSQKYTENLNTQVRLKKTFNRTNDIEMQKYNSEDLRAFQMRQPKIHAKILGYNNGSNPLINQLYKDRSLDLQELPLLNDISQPQIFQKRYNPWTPQSAMMRNPLLRKEVERTIQMEDKAISFKKVVLIILFFTILYINPAQQLVCGDCILDWPTESCDDCNIYPWDGCDSTCNIETGYYCIHTTDSSVCRELCGDGINVRNTYPCDDGNRLSKDGCSSTCQLEAGFTCTGYGVGSCVENCDNNWKFMLPCDIPTPGCISCVLQPGYICIRGKGCQENCGTTTNYGTKACEDTKPYAGDEYYGDGCDWQCNVEKGFTCPSLGPCTEVCGLDLAGGTYDFYNYPCDDGNNVNGDGCDSTCNVEPGYECYDGNPLQPDRCYEICGDGLDYNMWWCDDGNKISGDGCSSTCMIERGYSCTGGDTTHPDICTEICGDGIDHHFYQCDDGNIKNGDGCDQNCNIESGWHCMGGNFDTADKCEEICGDGIVINPAPGKCDDGNKKAGDGCGKLCDVEKGWSCVGGSPTSRDVCTEICGDGINAGGVQCDDGNTVDGDGCSSSCKFETGFTCSGGSLYTKDTCYEICGDGLNFGKWQCDDGNTKDGDGCDSSCKIETGWFCFNGSPTTRDVCRLKPQPKVQNMTLSSDNTRLTIKFNETIILDQKWSSIDSIQVYIEGPKGPYSMTWSLEDADFYKKQATDTFLIDLSVNDQIYGNLNQTLVVKFADQNYYMSYTSTRPLLNYTIGVPVNSQSDLGNDQANSSWIQTLVPILILCFGIFVLATAIFSKLSMVPLIYLICSVQVLQVTPVMQLMWPTGLNNFFQKLKIINFETTFIQTQFANTNNYSEINSYYTNSGYTSREFLYNAMDAMFFAGLMVALIPICFIIAKLVKVPFVQTLAQRYYIGIIHEVLMLIYLKIALSSFLSYHNFSINDKTQGISAMLNIIITFLVLFGLPALHLLLIMKILCLNRGVEKKFQKKPKSIIEKAQEEGKEEEKVNEEEIKQKDQKKGQIDKYLMFLQNPFAALDKRKEEEEKERKKEEELAKKKKEMGDDYTDSEEDDITDDQRKDMIAAQKRYNEYRFKKSFLYQMCWNDLNDHYANKLFFFVGFAASRLAYTYILDRYSDDSCIQVQYLMMINIASLAFVMESRSFRNTYLYNCVVIDEIFKTVASATYFAFYHKNSPRNTVQYFSLIIYWSIILMIILNIIFIIKELLRRSKGDFADYNVNEPEMPQIQKKEKKDNKADGDESDTSFHKKTPPKKKDQEVEETDEGESDELVSEELSVESYDESDSEQSQEESKIPNEESNAQDQTNNDLANSMNIGAQDVVADSEYDENDEEESREDVEVESMEDEDESDQEPSYQEGIDIADDTTYQSNAGYNQNLGLQNANRFQR